MALSPLLVDTNILLRIAEFKHRQDESLLHAIQRKRSTHTLCVALQNIAEFWNVATRPERNNGLGRTIAEAAEETDRIAERFVILPETQDTFAKWLSIVEQFDVHGVLVHDARLAALMLEHRISHILTLNIKDFARFPFITPIDPREAN